MTFDPMLQRKIMGHFATGVTLVTAKAGDQLWGMTANAVMSLSLDPPLILISVNSRSRMDACLKEAMCFALNVLCEDQESISRRFSSSGPKDFDGLGLKNGKTGAPILTEALAFVECRIVKVLSGGDHNIFFGEPIEGEVRGGNPLIFYGGEYGQMSFQTKAKKGPSPDKEDLPD